MRAFSLLSVGLCAAAFSAMSAQAQPYYYDERDYIGRSYRGDVYDRDSDDYYRRREEQRQLEFERDRIRDQREELAEERRELEEQRAQASSSIFQDAQDERCPAGFTQSEQKCSNAERKRGCKDVRLKNGIGCVKR